MTFAHPDLLWPLVPALLLGGVPLLAAYLRQRALRRFGDEAIVRPLIQGRSGPLRAGRGVLLVLSLIHI